MPGRVTGWSWRLNGFRIYKYIFDQDNWRFTGNSTPARLPPALRGPGRGTRFATIGDGGRRLQGTLSREYNKGLISGALDYHPLEYLYRQTQDSSLIEDSVGGAVQVSKVYRSIRVEHFAVRTADGLSVSGRPVLPYEHLDLRAIERRDDSGEWYTEASASQIPAARDAFEDLHEIPDGDSDMTGDSE